MRARVVRAMLLLGFAPTHVLSYVLLVSLLVPVVAGRRVCARGSFGFAGVLLLGFAPTRVLSLSHVLLVALLVPVVAGRRVCGRGCCYWDLHPRVLVALVIPVVVGHGAV